jgi:copper chaperone
MKFLVKNMTCGGCARSVTATIKELDPQAEVNIDVQSKEVSVNTTLSYETLQKELDEVGFPPEKIA